MLMISDIMGGIHIYPVTRGYARVTGGGSLEVHLFYDSDAEPQSKRVTGKPEWGIKVFDGLLRTGKAVIATPENPLRSPSGGMIYFLDDGSFLSNRRDEGAPTHKLWLSMSGGFPSCKRQTRYPLETCSAEGAESVLLTASKPHRLLVPKDDPVAEAIAEKSARRVGIAFDGTLEVPFEIESGPDVLKLYDGETKVSTTTGYIQPMWESEAAINLLQVAHVHHDPDDILPADTEYMITDGRTIYFNREVFRLRPEQVAGKGFGDMLENPVVYHLGPEGVPVLQTQEPPDKPYLYKPDDMIAWILHSKKIQPQDRLEYFLNFHRMANEAAKAGRKL